MRRRSRACGGFFARLGPGLIAGASDDDPSGVATYSQVGAKFGTAMLWTALFSLPFMVAVQQVSARIGRVTGQGIAHNLRRHYPRWLMWLVLAGMCVANVINIGADLAAMGESLKLIGGGAVWAWSAALALAMLGAQVYLPYPRYASLLKWLTLALLSYVAAAFMVNVPWKAALWGTLLPQLRWNTEYFAGIVAVLGTTISPYLFFWQASLESEEVKAVPEDKALKRAPEQAPPQIARIRFDTWVGMGVSNAIAFFIILTAAMSLHARGITDIRTAAEAAEALRPVGGSIAFILFALGIVGTGLLAVPALAGSAAFSISEALGWPASLHKRPEKAPRFYGVLAASVAAGWLLSLAPIDPMRALVLAAIANGIVAGPVMATLMWMAGSRRLMGQFAPLPPQLRIGGWLATALMIGATVGMFLLL